MPADLATLLASQHQVARTADLHALGLSSKEQQQLVAAGVLVRIRRGAFVAGQAWRSAPPWQRHRLRALAVHRELEGQSQWALSHHSALAVQGIALYGVDDRVHLGRTDAGRSRSHGLVVVHAGLSPSFVVAREGCRLVSPALACLQVAARSGVESGLVAAESAVQQSACTIPELTTALQALAPIVGRARARRVVELTGTLSESAGESRCRWLFLLLGLPAPVQQARIVDSSGALVGRVDFLFAEQRVVVEFDGLAKYAQVEDLRAEKLREDRLRELGYEVVRLTWADLSSPRLVHDRIGRAFARAAARRS